MNVSAIIVTRGDVDLRPILASLPAEWQKLVWDNGLNPGQNGAENMGAVNVGTRDLAVYGRYAAIEYASHDLIYVQDDDCVVSDPQAIVDKWYDCVYHASTTRIVEPEWMVLCNMPPDFRHDFYEDHALVGFGAVFHREAPQRAFERLNVGMTWKGVCPPHWSGLVLFDTLNFRRTCDIVFTALTPRVLVDVPYENLPWASDETRMWKQAQHVEERTRMLELVRKVRDA